VTADVTHERAGTPARISRVADFEDEIWPTRA
jgi:hypothetical protein